MEGLLWRGRVVASARSRPRCTPGAAAREHTCAGNTRGAPSTHAPGRRLLAGAARHRPSGPGGGRAYLFTYILDCAGCTYLRFQAPPLPYAPRPNQSQINCAPQPAHSAGASPWQGRLWASHPGSRQGHWPARRPQIHPPWVPGVCGAPMCAFAAAAAACRQLQHVHRRRWLGQAGDA